MSGVELLFRANRYARGSTNKEVVCWRTKNDSVVRAGKERQGQLNVFPEVRSDGGLDDGLSVARREEDLEREGMRRIARSRAMTVDEEDTDRVGVVHGSGMGIGEREEVVGVVAAVPGSR